MHVTKSFKKNNKSSRTNHDFVLWDAKLLTNSYAENLRSLEKCFLFKVKVGYGMQARHYSILVPDIFKMLEFLY